MAAAALVSVLLATACWPALVVVFFREALLSWQTLRARRRVLHGATPRGPPADARFKIDFGVGPAAGGVPARSAGGLPRDGAGRRVGAGYAGASVGYTCCGWGQVTCSNGSGCTCYDACF